MSPVYSHACPNCKDTSGQPKVHDFVRPMSRAGDSEICPDCSTKTERVYSFSRPKEFIAYEDEKFGCEVTSERQERKLLKQHGQVLFRETPAYDKPRWREARRTAMKKPMYFTSAGRTKMDRD